MRLLNNYVTKSFLLAFGMAIGILTFAMVGGSLIQAYEQIAKGVPLDVFCKFTLYMVPRILTFTVPWAVMVAVMLVFGRMSADNEVTAMRACGISILQILSPILLITIALTALCLYLQVEIGPPLLGKSRSMLQNVAVTQPLSLFVPGDPLKIPGADNNISISIEKKIGKDKLIGVQYWRTDDEGNVLQEISAESGDVVVDEEEQIMTVVLHECRVDNRAENQDANVNTGYAKELPIAFNYGKQANAANISVRAKYMTVKSLLGEIHRFKVHNQDTTKLEVELNKRIAFALSPIAFLLLGLPLAIRTSRRETSVGLFLSIVLAGGYFMSILLLESLKSPALYPQYLLWLPNIIFQLLGAVMTYKVSQR